MTGWPVYPQGDLHMRADRFIPTGPRSVSSEASWHAPVRLILTGLVIAGLGASCQETSKTREKQAAGVHVGQVKEPEVLTAELAQLLSKSFRSIVGTSSEIASKTSDRRIREFTLQWKLNAAEAMEVASAQSDPRRTFVMAWLLITQSRYALTQGEYRQAFGQYQPLAVETVTAMYDELLVIARRHLPSDMVERASREIEAVAKRYPWSYGMFDQQRLAKAEPAQLGVIGDVLKIPMTPVSGLQGVADVPAAIYSVSETVAELGRQLPQRTRWESELLLLELDSLDSVVQTRDNLRRFTDSVESGVKAFDAMPAEMRQEAGKLLADVDQMQPSIQKTVADARQTVEQADAVAEKLNSAMQKTNDASTVLKKVSEDVAKVAPSFEAGGRELAEMSRQLKSVTTDARAIITELKQPAVPGGAVAETFRLTNESLRGGINEANLSAEKLIDRATWRILLVMSVFFVFLVLYNVARRRFAPTSSASASASTSAAT